MFTDLNGNKIFILGANYWPSSSGLNMWSEWNPEEIEDDIKRMKSLGINVCRFFLYMPDFMPTFDNVDSTMIERLEKFLEICEKHEMYSLPSFFVGHMSGEDWDVSWRNGRNFLTDPDMIKAIKYYITEIVNSTKYFKYIIGWLLSNEIPNYVGQQDPEIIANWTRDIIETVKKLDSKRPVSIGDGAWTPEINSEYDRWKFQLRKLNKYQDFVGLHYYPRVISPWQHTYTTAFRLEMAQEWGKPVLVEEFGTSTVSCSEENQAHYYRSVFYSSLINNSIGVMGWCFNDFDFEDKRPYSHHAFEDRFGIVKTDKSIKPVGNEFIEFKKVIDELYSDNYQKVENNVGLLIPSNYYYKYPYQFKPEFDKWYGFYLESFSLMKNAAIDVECVIEPAIELNNENDLQPKEKLDPKKLPLLFAPRLKIFTKNYWRKIVDYIKKGGNLYCSFAVDSWVIDWHKLVGVEMDCKFGVPDFRDTDHLEITVIKDWGKFGKDEMFTIPIQNDNPEESYCPILTTDAEIIMKDQYGDPFLIKNKVGKGYVYFTPYPIEMLSLVNNDDSWKDNLVKIYRSIYNEIYKNLDFKICSNGLEMGIWKTSDSKKYKLIILNHSWNKNEGVLHIKNRNYECSSTTNFKQINENQICFELDRKGVVVFNLMKIISDNKSLG